MSTHRPSTNIHNLDVALGALILAESAKRRLKLDAVLVNALPRGALSTRCPIGLAIQILHVFVLSVSAMQ
jgi:hypothetical protein